MSNVMVQVLHLRVQHVYTRQMAEWIVLILERLDTFYQPGLLEETYE